MANRHTLLLCASFCALPAIAVALTRSHAPIDVPVAEARSASIIAAPLTVTPSATPDVQPSLDAVSPSGVAPPASQAARAIEASDPPVTPPQPLSAVATEPPPPTPEPTPAPSVSVLASDQLIVFYGSPAYPGLGVLGMYTPQETAARVRELAAEYDAGNGDRGARGAIDLIYGMATAEPGEEGLYVRYMKDDELEPYLRLAEEQDLQVFLDLQIGRGNIAGEVRKIERFLENPRIHVAIDPEYAVGPWGEPIINPGRMSGHEINEVQDYLSEFVRARNLPPKLVVIHQYLDDTIIEGEATRQVKGVELVLNMDAFGPVKQKREKYKSFANLPYAQHNSYNIFLKQDERISSSSEILELEPQPDVVFYQ